MLPIDLRAIRRTHIENLLTARIAEGLRLEFKRDADPDDADSKRKVLKEVCAFANTDGGDLLLGVEESASEPGVPVAAPGLPGEPTTLTERLQRAIRNGLDPPVDVALHPVEVDGGRHVLVVRLQRSWHRPHRVRSCNNEFYRRSGANSEPMSIQQVREAFLAGREVEARVLAFRDERLRQVKTKVSSASGLLVLHVVPIPDFQERRLIDLREMLRLLEPPRQGGGCSWRHNLNGQVAFDGNAPGSGEGYAQIFRDGSMEFVNTRLIDSNNGSRVLSPDWTRRWVHDALRVADEVAQQKELRAPFSIMVSMLDVRGAYVLRASPRPHLNANMPLEDESVLLPDRLAAGLDEDDVATVMAEAWDILWQAGGHSGADVDR